MSKQKSSLRRRYLNYVLLGVIGSIVLAGIIIISTNVIASKSYQMLAAAIFFIIAVAWAAFLCYKGRDFKCPKCKKIYDMRSWPKFCPHCGAPLETDEIDDK